MTEVMPLLLIVEDDTQMRKFLRASLSSHGYRLVEATDGTEGLSQAASYNPDLILLDLGLPDIDGLEVTKRLRQWASAPIIVISARGQEDDKIK
ncbi:MAG TPA: response regulator, partial [Polyangiaceae bacterium]|nr:response regulator [Polyangiaceae bacterium]